VVLMATEPPGVNLAPSDWAQFQIDHYRDITVRWDDMLCRLREDARRDDAVRRRLTDRLPIVTAPYDDAVDGVRPATTDSTTNGRVEHPLPTIIAALERADRMEGATP
jgi:hypothetical protein